MRLLRSLTFWIFAGLFAGLAAGGMLGEPVLVVADPLAELFLRLLRMAIMPLIVTSLVSAVIRVGARRNLEVLGAKTFAYYVTTSLLAILTGQVLVNLFRPGVGSSIELAADVDAVPAAQQSILDLLMNVIPENPFEALASGQVMPVIFFSILFGYFVTRLDEPQRGRLGDVFHGAFHAMLKLTHLVIWTAPLGVFGINARIVAICDVYEPHQEKAWELAGGKEKDIKRYYDYLAITRHGLLALLESGISEWGARPLADRSSSRLRRCRGSVRTS